MFRYPVMMMTKKKWEWAEKSLTKTGKTVKRRKKIRCFLVLFLKIFWNVFQFFSLLFYLYCSFFKVKFEVILPPDGSWHYTEMKFGREMSHGNTFFTSLKKANLNHPFLSQKFGVEKIFVFIYLINSTSRTTRKTQSFTFFAISSTCLLTKSAPVKSKQTADQKNVLKEGKCKNMIMFIVTAEYL